MHSESADVEQRGWRAAAAKSRITHEFKLRAQGQWPTERPRLKREHWASVSKPKQNFTYSHLSPSMTMQSTSQICPECSANVAPSSGLARRDFIRAVGVMGGAALLPTGGQVARSTRQSTASLA